MSEDTQPLDVRLLFSFTDEPVGWPKENKEQMGSEPTDIAEVQPNYRLT